MILYSIKVYRNKVFLHCFFLSLFINSNTKLILFLKASKEKKKKKTFQTGPNVFWLFFIPLSTSAQQRWGAQSGRVAAPPELMPISTAQVRERPAAAERRLTRPSSLWSPEHGWKRYLWLPRAAAKNRVKPPFELTAAWRVEGAGGGALRDTSPDSRGAVHLVNLRSARHRLLPFVS